MSAATSTVESAREAALQAARLFAGREDPSFDANTLYHLVCRRLYASYGDEAARSTVLQNLAPYLDLFAPFKIPPATVTPARQFAPFEAKYAIRECANFAVTVSAGAAGRVRFKSITMDDSFLCSCDEPEALIALQGGIAAGTVAPGQDPRIGVDEGGVPFGLIESILLTNTNQSFSREAFYALQLSQQDIAQIVARFEARFVDFDSSQDDCRPELIVQPGHEASSHLAQVAVQVGVAAAHGARPSDALWRRLMGTLNAGHPARNELLCGLLDVYFLQCDQENPPDTSIVEALLRQDIGSDRLLDHACHCCCAESVRLSLRYDTSIDSDELTLSLDRFKARGSDSFVDGLEEDHRSIVLMLSSAIAHQQAQSALRELDLLSVPGVSP